MKKQVAGMLALGVTLTFAHSVRANLITDGDFESGQDTVQDSPNSAYYTSFVGWNISHYSGGSVGSGTSSAPYTTVTAATAPISGSSSAKIQAPGAAGNVEMYQDFTSANSSFNLTLSAAALEPGSGGRAVNLLLGSNSGDPADAPVINFKVIPAANNSTTTGDVQLYLGSAFTTVLSNAFNWSTPGNYDTASEPVNTIQIAGTMSASGVSYTVTVDGASTGTETQYQNAPNGTLSELGITSPAGAANASFIVDNVSVTPEPAALSLLSLGALGLLKRRRACR